MLNLKLTRPLVCFDTETTGVNIETDRVIDLAGVVFHVDGTQREFAWRFNPGVPIPEEATAVHGITREMLKTSPMFGHEANDIARTFGGCDYAGFNVRAYDLPILRNEFKRCNVECDLSGKVIDALEIFRRNEPRDLPAALRFYCGRDHLGAHSACADTTATIDVLAAQMERYGLTDDVGELATYCRNRPPNALDDGGKCVWSNGAARLTFGKHAGVAIQDVPADYWRWLIGGTFENDLKEIAKNALRGFVPSRPAMAEKIAPAF